MIKFTRINSKLNLYIGFMDLNPDPASIKFVVNNIAKELNKGAEDSLTRVAYNAQIEEIQRTQTFIEYFGTKYFFGYCQDQINRLSKSINNLLQLS